MGDEELIEKARQFVEDECKKDTAHYGYDPYPFHLVHMHKAAKEMALDLGADAKVTCCEPGTLDISNPTDKREGLCDIEVVRLAAWLHDIGSITQGRVDHHINGARIAGEKLKEWGYDDKKIEKVKKCILNHRGSVLNDKGSVEEVVIADADGIVNFDNLAGIFKAAFMEGKDQAEAKIYAKDKLEKCYNKLSSNGKGIARERYDAAMLLLGGEDDN